jgi:predicted DNA-binding transcriptional regulator YafY
MKSRLYKQLESAMDNHNRIDILYDDHRRIVEPFFIAETKDDKIIVNTWHYSGYSSQGFPDPDNHWRTYVIDKIQELNIIDEEFYDRPGYNPDTRLYKRILKYVKFDNQSQN